MRQKLSQRHSPVNAFLLVLPFPWHHERRQGWRAFLVA
jgi:hypothetical protein